MIAPEKSIELKINEILLAEQEKRKDRVRSGKWSPSQFGGCFRKQYWNRKNEPKTNPPDERALRVFKAGHFFHDFVQGLITKGDNNAEIEVLIEDENVCGYADIVLSNEVVEVKSQHSRAFWWMNKSNKSIIEEKINNVLQNTYYAVRLGKEFIRLVYVSKDDLCINEYKLRVTDQLKEMLRDELDVLNGWWKANRLPSANPRLYIGKDGKSKECNNYCDWKDKCKEVERENDNQKENREKHNSVCV